MSFVKIGVYMARIDDFSIEDDIFDLLVLYPFLVSMLVCRLGMQFSYLTRVPLIES
jgi:hypothetical protein